MVSTEIEIERRDRSTHGEYLASVAGESGKGKLTWTQRGNVRHAEHTLVPSEMRGQGIAAELVRALVKDAERDGFKISPDCSYVEASFRRHPEWAELRA